jgi:hypothetical protein
MVGSVDFFNNVSIAGGPAPARPYIEELLPDVLEGRISVEDSPGAREAIKVLIEP